ncbi:outer membrane receptor for ferrienterochelin and colicins [Chitinophaga sp. CF118]|uniref:TonB-dependent receptor plug domain-containing protein n=1 Tax=Chitinophaga sp. CF118 TaxID=1884367 RepID=UPI0008E8497C|nr:TonB-dependent receptor [Chitinophaga sp. CF118]SFD18536.1 outer membrane receptor for ferrienterochelin and colicins [Chitinophaga sp. CF118]
MKLHVSVLIFAIAVSGNTWAQSVVKMDSVLLHDVVVTGQYKPQSLKNSVYQIRTITAAYIQQRAATSVLGVLDYELGVRFSADATLGETDVELMGMSGASVKVLLDGVPLVDRGSTRQSLTQIDINTIERIEIVEGPMSVVYGTDALAGVINIITKKNTGNTLAVAARVQEETVGKEYAAFSGKGLHNENLNVNWSQKGFFAGGGITRNDFGGWADTLTGRKKAWKPKEQLMTNATFGYGKNNFKVWYRLDYLNEDLISRGDINYNNAKATDQHYFTERYTHQAQAVWQLNNDLSLNGTASYQQYQRRTRTTIKSLDTGAEVLSTDDGAQDVSSFNTLFFRGTAQYTLSSAVSFQPGIEFRRDASTGQRIEGTPVINDYSVFISSEIKPVAGINIRPGVRINKNSLYDAPPVIPSLNTKFSLSKNLDLRLSYARGFRAPALRELYFYFFDASHSIKGNRDLKAEYSNSFTGSLSWQALQTNNLRIGLTATGFYNQFNNRIDIAYPANSDTATYVNINKFKTTGGTLNGTLNWKNIQAGLGFSYIGRYNAFADDAAYDKSYPTPQLVWTPEVNSNISYRFTRIGATLNLSYKYNGTRPVYEEVTNVDGSTYIHLAKTSAFHNAEITATKKVTKYVTVNGGARNLFNTTNLKNTTLNSGQAHSEGSLQPMWYGRSYFLGLSFNWNK